MKEYFELIEKYGIKPLFVIVIIWLNNRVGVVEERLSDCYNERIKEAIIRSTATAGTHVDTQTFYAIIPHDIYTKKHIQRYIKA